MILGLVNAARAEDGKDPMALLREAHGLMQNLADKRLPAGDCGDSVRADELRIVRNFDALIKMILEQDSPPPNGQEGGGQDGKTDGSSDGSQKPPSGQPAQQPGAAGSQAVSKGAGASAPATKPGGVSTGSPAPRALPPSDGDGGAWGIEPPPKDYHGTTMTKGTTGVSGYEDLIRKVREAIAREAVKIR
jgi:hypothetical protein